MRRNVEKGGFFYEELAAQPPGTSDTSRIATDHINNPNAINAIFLLAERERIAATEKMAGGTLALPGEKEEMAVASHFEGRRGFDRRSRRDDSRLRQHRDVFRVLAHPSQPLDRSDRRRSRSKFRIAQEHSVFWRATEERLANIAAFFRRLQPFRLADAPGGAANITTDEAVLNHGKQVFANSCASCHSSKQPPAGIDPQSGDGKAWFRAAVMQPDFLENNFLSNREALSTLRKSRPTPPAPSGPTPWPGHIWDNFSSQTYKELPLPDEVEFYNPFDETQPIKFQPKSKHTGPGYLSRAFTR